jgi:hypothetical protein
MFRANRKGHEINTQMAGARSSPDDRLKIEDIVRRAYEIHRERGGWFGFDFEDWTRAWAEWPGKSGALRTR